MSNEATMAPAESAVDFANRTYDILRRSPEAADWRTMEIPAPPAAWDGIDVRVGVRDRRNATDGLGTPCDYSAEHGRAIMAGEDEGSEACADCRAALRTDWRLAEVAAHRMDEARETDPVEALREDVRRLRELADAKTAEVERLNRKVQRYHDKAVGFGCTVETGDVLVVLCEAEAQRIARGDGDETLDDYRAELEDRLREMGYGVREYYVTLRGYVPATYTTVVTAGSASEAADMATRPPAGEWEIDGRDTVEVDDIEVEESY